MSDGIRNDDPSGASEPPGNASDTQASGSFKAVLMPCAPHEYLPTPMVVSNARNQMDTCGTVCMRLLGHHAARYATTR